MHGLADLPTARVARPAFAPAREAVLALLAGLLQRQRGGDARGGSRQCTEHLYIRVRTNTSLSQPVRGGLVRLQ